MATVILLNPYGSDVTNFVNGTALVPQLLKGTVMSPGDTLYTLPYNNSVSSLANIEAGVTLLDAKIRSTTGSIKVFGYSEGCQIADLWISGNYTDATVTSLPLSFLSIGNADRKFGGFAYGHSVFSSVGYNGGLPATVPWPYIDFARQYDFVADFPTSTAIQSALGGLSGTLNTTAQIAAALNNVTAVMSNENQQMAALNAIAGLTVVHDFYENVSPADPENVSFTDTNGVQYVLSVTYPVPSLGIATLSPDTDKLYRAQIETQYNRPFTLVPQPSYGTATVFTLADAFMSGPGYLTSALGGAVTRGNSVVPITYPNWTVFETQVTSGAEILNSAITSTAGQKVVFGHGLGAVVASNWLRNYGPSSTVPADELSFILIGNRVRLYGGRFNSGNGVGGFFPNSYPIPADTPYSVIDFCRQYDGLADYPQLTGNANDNMWALLNSISGEGNVHPYYNNVTIDDAANVWHTPAQSNISWVWSPTWPLPIYGTSQDAITQLEDNELRATVEGAYSRPVVVNPNYTGSPYTQTVRPTGIASAAVFGTVNVSIGARAIIPDGIATDGLFGETWVWFVGTITPKGIPSGEQFGNLSIPFPATVLPTPMATHAFVGIPTVTAA